MNMFQKLWRLVLIASMMAGALNVGMIPATPAFADSAAQTLPFTQNWNNTGLITVNDDWAGVPGITGYLGQNITTATGADPQTLLTESILAGDVTVLANQATAASTSGDVGEFELADSVIALQGSGTADAPYIQIAINTTGKANINVSYNLRDIDGAADNAVQPVALQYRVGNSGDFTNVASGFVADATSGPSLATLVTPVSATLPAAADNQALVQVRIITANAVGSDEWVGIDDISITGGTAAPSLSINDVSASEGNSGTTTFTFTAALSSPAPAGGVTFDIATAAGTATADDDYQSKTLTNQSIAEGVSDYTFNVTVYGDTTFETNETFTVDVTNVTGATVADGQGLGTITNDDAALPVLSINDVTVAEGNSGTTNFGFVVSLDVAAPVGGVTFDIATADGTATTADSDYVGKNLTTQTIPEGSTSYNFDVTVNGDANIESTEAFNVNVTNVTGATVGDGQGLGTITNDDAATPNISISNVSGPESNAGTNTFTFNVSLDIPALAGGVTFDIATSNGTATTADNDYVANSANLVTIAEGSSSTTFNVTVNGDTTFEADETFNVTLSSVSGANISNGTGVGTIQNDDAAPANLSIADVTVAEGNSGTTTFGFVVTLDVAAPVSGVTFDIATSDGTATIANSDYVLNSVNGAAIASGNTTYNFDVTVNGDWDNESNETFNVTVSNVTGAVVSDGAALGTITNDDSAVTLIHDIQGSGSASAVGTFTVDAIVVGDYQAQTTGQLKGFFIQEEDADVDANPATSEGIFVFCNTCTTAVSVGDKVRVTGATSEYFLMSQLNATTVDSVSVLSTGNNLPTPASLQLPIPGVPSGDLAAAETVINAYYETFEGMLVTFPDTLSVSEYFELARYGQVILSEGGRPHTFTAVNTPTALGYINHQIDLAGRTIILDDTDNRQNRPSDVPNTAYYYPVPGLSTSNFFRGGDTITNLTGVLHWSFAGQTGTDAWRIRPVTEKYSYAFTQVNPRSAVPTVNGSLKVASFNVLNYFLTIDTSNVCAPTQNQDCRGADSAQELDRQRTKMLAALTAINADVFGFMEMENTTGVEPLADIVAGLPGYGYINTGVVGGDAIRVGIIYKTSKVTPVGAYKLLTSAVDVRFDDTKNRPALAQTFVEIASGEKFTVVVNHLKSKGSSCGVGDDDTTTGQGNCNGTRTLAAQALADWLDTDPTGSGDPDFLIIGDLNSYAKEDPIVALQTAGFTDMVAAFGGPDAYGYVFDGQLGYLDHALANTSLASQVADLAEWHINADENPLFDYNDDERTADEATFDEESDVLPLYAPNEFRTSDHDPIIIGLNLDAVAPTVTSSVRVGSTPTNASSVDFTVTFSEAVFNVDKDDFDLTLGGSVVGAGVTSVTPVTSSVYTVSVNTGSGDGTLRLNIKASPSIQDAVGNAFVGPYIGGQSYTIDKTSPTIVSVVRVGVSPTNSSSVDFTVTFSEPVIGVDMTSPTFNDFTLSTSAGISGAAVTAVSGSNTTYTVTVNTGTGNGTLRLNVGTSGDIADAALNPFASSFNAGQIYSIIKTATFVDVPLTYWANSFIERLAFAGITGGCSTVPMMYCPEAPVTRAQMAIFLLRGIHGSSYTPPAVGASTGFTDVPVDHPAAAWIKQLAAEGITGGCGVGIYCPDAIVTRAQMAIFLLRAKYTSSYAPPAATGDFVDVPISHPAAAWIEQLAAEGITTGCGAGIYCPDNNVTRDQMAIFLVKTFDLP